MQGSDIFPIVRENRSVNPGGSFFSFGPSMADEKIFGFEGNGLEQDVMAMAKIDRESAKYVGKGWEKGPERIGN